MAAISPPIIKWNQTKTYTIVDSILPEPNTDEYRKILNGTHENIII